MQSENSHRHRRAHGQDRPALQRAEEVAARHEDGSQREERRERNRLLQEDDRAAEGETCQRGRGKAAAAQEPGPLPERHRRERRHPRVRPHFHRLAQEEEAPGEQQGRPGGAPVAQEPAGHRRERRDCQPNQAEVQAARRERERARALLERAGERREQVPGRRMVLLEEVDEGPLSLGDEPGRVQVLDLVVIAARDRGVQYDGRRGRREQSMHDPRAEHRQGGHSTGRGHPAQAVRRLW